MRPRPDARRLIPESSSALAAGVVLTDLRAGGANLEDLFLELTSTTQRDALPPPHQQPHEHMPPVPAMPFDAPTNGGPRA